VFVMDCRRIGFLPPRGIEPMLMIEERYGVVIL
jgi:hypothetical protein